MFFVFKLDQMFDKKWKDIAQTLGTVPNTNALNILFDFSSNSQIHWYIDNSKKKSSLDHGTTNRLIFFTNRNNDRSS